MVDQADLEGTVGATNDYTITAKQPVPNQANPLDLTGASIWFTMKRRYKDADSLALVQKTVGAGITVPTPANGVANLSLAPADTVALEPGLYHYDVKVKEGTGRETVIVRGKFNLLPAATKST